MTKVDPAGAAAAEALRVGCQRSHDELADALARAGFHRVDQADERWRGTITFQRMGDSDRVTLTTLVDIVVPTDFPVASEVVPGLVEV